MVINMLIYTVLVNWINKINTCTPIFIDRAIYKLDLNIFENINIFSLEYSRYCYIVSSTEKFMSSWQLLMMLIISHVDSTILSGHY